MVKKKAEQTHCMCHDQEGKVDNNDEAGHVCVCVYVQETASTNSPLMKSLVNLISGTSALAALPLLQPLVVAIDARVPLVVDGNGGTKLFFVASCVRETGSRWLRPPYIDRVYR